MLKKICEYCKKDFTISSKHKHQKFCSIQCSSKTQKIPDIFNICKFCEKKFSIRSSKKSQKFCNHSCSAKFHFRKPKISKICQQCNKEFEVYLSLQRIHFCSQKCYWDNLKGKPNGRKSKGIKIICKTCGTKLVVPLNLKNKKFCSRRCQNIGYKGIRFSPKTQFKKGNVKEKCINWKGGISYEPYPVTFDQQLKDKIRVRDNFICQLCGIPELECNERLHIHHIDYIKKNCGEKNLISLCCSCHMKMQVKREYWTNFFQTKFQEVTHNGKLG